MAINTVVIVGRLTKNPELKQTNSGISVCGFSVAVDRAYKSGEERQADFIDCTAWRNSADFLGKYFKKGDMIGVTGHLQTRSWETDDGQRRKATEIVVDNLSFVGGKRQSGQDEQGRQSSAPSGNQGFSPLDFDDDDIPF